MYGLTVINFILAAQAHGGVALPPPPPPSPPVVVQAPAPVVAKPAPVPVPAPVQATPEAPAVVPAAPSTTYTGLECVVALTDPEGNTVTFSPGPAVAGSCDTYNVGWPAGDTVTVVVEPVTSTYGG